MPRFDTDASIPLAQFFPGNCEAFATAAGRSSAGVSAPRMQGHLPANWLPLRPGCRTARRTEAHGTALRCQPANHTTRLAAKSQMADCFRMKRSRVQKWDLQRFSTLEANDDIAFAGAQTDVGRKKKPFRKYNYRAENVVSSASGVNSPPGEYRVREE